MTRARTLITAGLVSITIACGGSSDSNSAAEPDAAAPGTTESDAGDDSGGDQDTLRLRVNSLTPGGAIPAGRLVVAWFQLDETDPSPEIEIGLDLPFEPSAGTVDVPLGSIAPPRPENLVCQRDCQDEIMCPCLSTLRVGLALVGVVADANNNGAIEVPGEFGNDNVDGLYGLGYVVVGTSERTFDPVPAPFSNLFAERVLEGVAAYKVLPPSGADMTNALGAPNGPSEFELDVCVPGDASCANMRVPDLAAAP